VTGVPRRIDVVLEPGYLDGLAERPLTTLQALHDECTEVETEVSYVRRLAQARLEILRAEQDRRARGGSVAELVAALPRILADAGPRPAPSVSRVVTRLAPDPAIEWSRGRESLITDDTLATLPDLTDAQLLERLDGLGALERETSDTRRALHRVIDVIDVELARRQMPA